MTDLTDIKSTAHTPGSTEKGSPAMNTPPPPPPSSRKPARVALNTRILADRDERLSAYIQRHEATKQAVVDQMIDEYLERRGLLDD